MQWQGWDTILCFSLSWCLCFSGIREFNVGFSTLVAQEILFVLKAYAPSRDSNLEGSGMRNGHEHPCKAPQTIPMDSHTDAMWYPWKESIKDVWGDWKAAFSEHSIAGCIACEQRRCLGAEGSSPAPQVTCRTAGSSVNSLGPLDPKSFWSKSRVSWQQVPWQHSLPFTNCSFSLS
jgi:hypothetical protein